MPIDAPDHVEALIERDALEAIELLRVALKGVPVGHHQIHPQQHTGEDETCRVVAGESQDDEGRAGGLPCVPDIQVDCIRQIEHDHYEVDAQAQGNDDVGDRGANEKAANAAQPMSV